MLILVYVCVRLCSLSYTNNSSFIACKNDTVKKRFEIFVWGQNLSTSLEKKIASFSRKKVALS